MCEICKKNNVDTELEVLLHPESEMQQENNIKLRNNYNWELANEKDFEQDSETASKIPSFISDDFSTPGYTFYINIDLGYGYNTSGKSFRITPKTGIYIPGNFSPQSPVDLIIYLHGYKSGYPGDTAAIDKYWDGSKFPFFALREEVNKSGNSNVIFVAPTLGPRSQAGTLIKTGGFDDYINKVTAAINEYVIKKRSLGRGIKIGKLILAAHSGGGLPMLRIIQTKDHYAGKINECWAFDSLYQGVEEWTKWANLDRSRKLFVYYLGSTTGNAIRLKNIANKNGFKNIVVQQSSKGHYWVPKLHFPERIKALSNSTIQKEFSNEYEDVYVHDETEIEAENNYNIALGEKLLSEILNESESEPVQYKGTEFAKSTQSGSYWPLISKKEAIVHYKSDKGYVGNRSRSFGWLRDGGDRYHVAIDLDANFRDPVVACQNGKILSHSRFCCQVKDPKTGVRQYPKQVSYSLLVDHGDIVINYGEVDKDLANGLKVNDTVKAGQIMGYVGKNPGGSSMLHFETYKSRTTSTKRWLAGKQRPVEVLDPTNYLLHLKNKGLRATNSKTTGSGNLPVAQPGSAGASTYSSGIQKAVKANSTYSQRLGWLNYQLDIEKLLGFKNESPVQERFAEAVAVWQQNNKLTVDGIIGPKTWRLMQNQLRPGSDKTNPKSSGAGSANRELQRFISRINPILPYIEKYRGAIPLSFILGWIWVESRGDITEIPKYKPGTKDLDERGYFQISKDESIHLKFDHTRLSRDPEYSVQSGISLINSYTKAVKGSGIDESNPIFWKLVKLWHAASGIAHKIVSYAKTKGFGLRDWNDLKGFILTKEWNNFEPTLYKFKITDKRNYVIRLFTNVDHLSGAASLIRNQMGVSN